MPRLAWHLRQLRERAGNPSYRRLAQLAHFSASTLAEAAKGDRLPSLEVTLAYARACGGDEPEWHERWSVIAAELAIHPVPVEEERCPYQGLTAFQPEEAEWFFGRSELVARLLDRIGQVPLVGVFGASGSGKSSLLRAGLLGAIAADLDTARRWHAMVMTPTEHPVGALAGQVAKLTSRDLHRVIEDLAADSAALDVTVRGALARGPEDARALLVVDQFEEVFTLCADDDERRTFIDALLDASGPAGRITVVLGIRADFLSHVSQHPGLVEALAGDASMLVGPVQPDGLREIVTRPAAHAGLGVAPELVATVLADAAGEPGALPLVSHALRETWQRRTGPTLMVADYHASGGVRGAIAQTAEQLYAALDDAQQTVVRRTFLRLTALGDGHEDTRRPIGRSELDGVAAPAVVADVLDRLTEARLIVVGDDRVEVAHEALIRAWPRLHRWLADDRDALHTHRRLTDAAQTWQSLARDSGALYRGAQLQTARAWAADHLRELNELERAFLDTSAAAEAAEQAGLRRRTRLLQRLVAVVSALLVLAMLGGAVAIKQRQDARRQERVALASEKALQARQLLASDPRLAGRLAIEAEQLDSTPDTIGSVLSAAAAPRRVELNSEGPVYGLAFSPDHTVLAAANADGKVTLWDPARRRRLATLTGHSGRGMKVMFSRDGALLVSTAAAPSSGTPGSIIVWDASARRQRARFEVKGLTGALAVSGDGSTIAVGATGGEVAVLDVASGARRSLRAHKAPVTSLSFSPDESMLVSTSPAEHPIAWTVATGKPTPLAADHVFSVEFGQSGTLAGSADDKGVYLWSLDRGRLVPLPSLPRQDLFSWTISNPVGGTIAVADENGAITLWDLRRRAPIQRFQDRGRAETTSVTLSQDGALLASAGFNGTIVLNDLRRARFAGFDAQVKDVDVSPDGALVASAGTDGAVRLWHPDGTPIAALTGHPDQVEAVAFSPDSRRIAAVTRNNVVTIWDVASRQRLGAPLRPVGAGAATDVAFDHDGRFLAAATLGMYVWDVRDPARPKDITTQYPYRFVTSLVFTPDGRQLVAASVAGYVFTWDAAAGTFIGRTETDQGAVQDVAVSPDGSLLATAGDSRVVKLWDAATRREVAVLDEHTGPVHVLAFSRDGRRLATAGDDHTIVIWDTASRRRIATLTGHTARIRGLAFTRDGVLVSGAEDGRIVRWTLDVQAARALLG